MFVSAVRPSSVETLRRRGFGEFLHRDADRWIATERSTAFIKRRLPDLSAAFAPASPMPPERWREASDRVVHAFGAAVGAPLPGEVKDEVILRLATRPGTRLEYVGRGRASARAALGEVLYLDTIEGRRRYAFRRLDGDAPLDERLTRVSDVYARAGRWLDDPSARVVMSLGGGGFRLFAAQSALRAIEYLLAGDRTRIDEVWGSSGGALLGYAFANGHDLSVIEELGYLVYHGRRADLPGLDLANARALVRRSMRALGDGPLRPEMSAWVDAIDTLCPPERRKPTSVPFYALASNTRWRHPVALADARHVPEGCDDFVLACDPREATGASMAVPFLVTPLRGAVPGHERDLWFDGSVVEENPLLLPFTKWIRDRRRDPRGTPSKLKIVMVHLNMRFTESSAMAALPAALRTRLQRATDLVDLMLDSKTTAVIRTLREVGDVEVLSATLRVGQLSFITRRGIPALVRAGQVIEGWHLDFHDGTTPTPMS